MSLSAIFNAVELDDGTLLAGMPDAGQCQEVAAEGFGLVINLAPEDAEGALLDESSVWTALDVEYLNIPVPWQQPTAEHLDQFIAAMGSANGTRIFVHCQANFRVTAFYAIYAARRLGWTRDKAQRLIDRIWLSRPDYRMDETWRGFVEAGFGRKD